MLQRTLQGYLRQDRKRGREDNMIENKAVSDYWGDCLACGYHNEQDETRCEKCGRRLQPSQRWDREAASNRDIHPVSDFAPDGDPSARAGGRLNASPSADQFEFSDQPQGLASMGPLPIDRLRRQLKTRVRDFRSRRSNGSLRLQFEEEENPGNKVIPFESIPSAPVQATAPSAMPRVPRRRPSPVQQQPLDFPTPPEHLQGFLALPVAPFRSRLIGHGMDFALTVAALMVFLLPLRMLAGPVEVTRLLVMGSIAAYLVLVLLYGALFLYVAGATPTMKWVGLRLVNFDGMPPRRHQLLFRFLGAIASVGSFFLGFLWAYVDEEGLSWHDRISRTFLTTAHR